MDILNIKVEPCTVEWDGDDMGFTDGDLEVAPEEQSVDIMAHQEGTNVLDSIRTGNGCKLSVTLKETSLAKLQALLAVGGDTDAGVARVQTLLCVADVSGSLNNKVLTIQGKHPTTKVVTNFLLWFNVNSAGTDPSLPGFTSVEVVLATGAVANTVADTVAAALDALSEFVAPNPAAATITITDALEGAREASDAGNSGFTFGVSTAGVSDVTGWGKSKNFTSMLADSGKLVLHPLTKASNDLSSDFFAWKAYPMLNSIVKSGENPNSFTIEFKIFPDMTKPDTVRLFGVGDHS